jgi:glucosyl-3-phosphoglycerate synthase
MADVRTFHPDDTWTVGRALVAKRDAGLRIAVCVPCRNESATIGSLVADIRTALVDEVPLVDDLVVLDDGSVDDSAALATGAGARVVDVADTTRPHGLLRGKGNVLWASLLATDADVVVWCDADLTSFEPSWVVRLVLPLLLEPSVGLVKADYHRPDDRGGGGRTTELVARPMLSLYFPGLTALAQPLGGEFAGRRALLEQLPFVAGWGVEVGLLVDVMRRAGLDAIAQVDLGVRRHRHRPLSDLSVQAAEVAATVLARAGVATGTPGALAPVLHRADGTQVPLNLDERPPVASLPPGASGSGQVDGRT